jgi:hypothetical protein
MNIGCVGSGVEWRAGRGIRPPGAAAIAAVLLLCGSASRTRAQGGQLGQPDSTGTIVGIVTTTEGGLPLPYSVVSVSAIGREQFSNDQGVFTLGALHAGPTDIRIRHLGYTPVDMRVVVHAGRIDSVHIALTHIAVRLATMRVSGHTECKNPGAPKRSADSAFATVFEQLRQNADQFRLLTATYPYVYAVERSFSTSLVNGDVKMGAVDTLAFASADGWKYRPGTVVQREGVLHTLGFGTLTMHIPTLANFAEPAFIDNHCFYNSGIENVDGADLLRIDFVAASKLSDPDVDGSMYLDPTNFEIRRSVVRLSRIPSGLAGLAETEAQTYFGEVVTSVPVITGIMSVNRFVVRSRQPDAATSENEQQQLVAFKFLHGKPGDIRKP